MILDRVLGSGTTAPEAKTSYELSVKQTKLYKLFLDWAIKKKVDGIVVGATYPSIIKNCKKKIKNSLDIYSPGVGTQGGNTKEVINAEIKKLEILFQIRQIIDLHPYDKDHAMVIATLLG